MRYSRLDCKDATCSAGILGLRGQNDEELSVKGCEINRDSRSQNEECKLYTSVLILPAVIPVPERCSLKSFSDRFLAASLVSRANGYKFHIENALHEYH